MIDGRGSKLGERRGGRQPGSKNKATLEHENMISRAMGQLDRPLGKEVIAEIMMEFRRLAAELTGAARAGDKEAQQKRVYYQGTLETDKANYRSPASPRARGDHLDRCARSTFSISLSRTHVFVRATRSSETLAPDVILANGSPAAQGTLVFGFAQVLRQGNGRKTIQWRLE